VKIRRIDLNGSDMEVVARGVRNSVGFDWSPRNKQLYFTDNGRDWLSGDAPQPRQQAGPGFRRALLLPGQVPRHAIRLGPLLR
jgi:hypothetical protein